ncbi:MAG: primosomal protein N', partial [Asticcacaulis sp.]
MATAQIAAVLLPLPLPEAFDYRVPDDLALAPGDHVRVPLGPRDMRGVVIRVRPLSPEDKDRRLKPVRARIEDPPLPAESLAFLDWVARWTLAPPGQVLLGMLAG